MPLQIIREDITRIRADAIVNTANRHPVYEDGTDRAVYTAAGAGQLLEERRKIGDIPVGMTAVTPGFALPARYIIHTVGPVWKDGEHGEADAVRSCYRESLRTALDLQCASVAFPLIATGNNGFPKELALQIAMSEFSSFLMEHDMEIILAVFDKSAFTLSGRLFEDVDAFIDENYVELAQRQEYISPRRRRNRAEQEEIYGSILNGEAMPSAPAYSGPEEMPTPAVPAPQQDAAPAPEFTAAMPSFSPKDSLERLLNRNKEQETFQERLFSLIAERKLSNAEVYRRANLDRKHFSKIQCNPAYSPKKRTVLALVIALRLDMDEAADLLQRAEYAFSPGSKADLIVEYCIMHGIYDIFEVNELLFTHDQPGLGA